MSAKPEPFWIERIAAGHAPRLRNPGESTEDYRVAMGWDQPSIKHEPGSVPPRWRVGEFVSSSNPRKLVLMLAVGKEEIAEYGAHRDFIRWITPHQFHVGDRVLFRGVLHTIFAEGDRSGTFDVHQPGNYTADRWLNVSPDALKPVAGVAPAAGGPAE